WTYKRWTSSKSSLQSQHQTIYFYGKTSVTKFKTLFTEYSPTTNIDQILQNRVRDENGKTKYKTDENGVVEVASDKRGVPLGDVWEIPYLNPKAKERVGYPTQKPILLLEKIIEISTDEGDLVLDPFCGSGTTLVAAKLMNRKFIGIDISKEACELSKTRLANPVRTESNLLRKGKNAYLSKSDFEYKVLNLLGATPVQRNTGIDGFIKISEQEQVIPVKIQKHTETIQEAALKLSNATFKKGLTKKILIKTSEKETKDPISLPKDENLIVLETLNLSLQKALQSSASNSGLDLFPHTSNGRK
ncbi:MAG: site-specific DNA-methyltransferase, partial [Oscillospiraceae bacterium]|nr:site-specific DNA-methyltransferase [Oscillospiraceae bacterium]